MKHSHYEILIIGGGPAAITLCKELSGERKAAVIRPEEHSMIYCAMPYAIEGLLPPEKTLKADSLVTETGAELIRDTVLAVDFEGASVTTVSGKVYTWDELVIATGADPILPPLPGASREGVMTFKREEEMYRINGLIASGLTSAVVVGAGAIGVELAQALAAKNVGTTLVDMADSVLPNLADPEMTAPALEELTGLGIRVELSRKVVEIRESSVVLDDGRELEGALVVFAVGMKPALSLFENSGLEMDRDGIIVDERMQTNLENVYAVGDCTSFFSGITGERTGGKLATNAVPMARVLAANLLGRERSYRGFFNGAATKAGNLFIGGTGLKEKEAAQRFDVITGYAEFTTAFPIMPGASKVRVKLIADRESGRIVGGQVVSGKPVTDKVDQISMAVQYGLTVDDLLAFSYSSQPWQSFYPAHNLLVKAAEELALNIRSAVR